MTGTEKTLRLSNDSKNKYMKHQENPGSYGKTILSVIPFLMPLFIKQ